MIESQLCDFN